MRVSRNKPRESPDDRTPEPRKDPRSRLRRRAHVPHGLPAGGHHGRDQDRRAHDAGAGQRDGGPRGRYPQRPHTVDRPLGADHHPVWQLIMRPFVLIVILLVTVALTIPADGSVNLAHWALGRVFGTWTVHTTPNYKGHAPAG